MAADIVKRTYACLNCDEMLEFDRKDCIISRDVEVPDDVIYPRRGMDALYDEIWYLRCPSCGKFVHVHTFKRRNK
jgi:hypothetical protein